MTEATEVKISDKLQSILTSIETLTVLELAELVKALEVKFGVSAAAAAPVARRTPLRSHLLPGQDPGPGPGPSISWMWRSQTRRPHFLLPFIPGPTLPVTPEAGSGRPVVRLRPSFIVR